MLSGFYEDSLANWLNSIKIPQGNYKEIYWASLRIQSEILNGSYNDSTGSSIGILKGFHEEFYKESARILQGFHKDVYWDSLGSQEEIISGSYKEAIENSKEIPKGFYKEIHGESVRILQRFYKEFYGILKEIYKDF